MQLAMVRYTIEAIVKLKLESQKRKITLAKGPNHDRHSFSNEYIREVSLLFLFTSVLKNSTGLPKVSQGDNLEKIKTITLQAKVYLLLTFLSTDERLMCQFSK